MGLGAAMISSLSVAVMLNMTSVEVEEPLNKAPTVGLRTFDDAPSTPAATAAGTKPPHIVLMAIDDLGWTDVGYHGSLFHTPNIDKLATEEGVRLEKYYVQPTCSPTRSALMTA